MNRVVLSAQLVQRNALRYTPAGLPALDVQLLHESEVAQDCPPRKLQFPLKALAIGGISSKLAAMALGTQAMFGGYLAPARNGKGLILHIQDIES
jgi:primosomal replication protein N